MSNFRGPIRSLAEGEDDQTAAPSGNLFGTMNASTLKIGGTTVGSTAVELDRVADVSARTVAAGSTLSLTLASHGDRTILLDTATGSVVTLPAATGSGVTYTFIVTVLATSNSHKIQVANGTDVMRGVVSSIDTDTSDAVGNFATTSTSDTITLNRSTTGSVYIGETFKLIDAKVGFWSVSGFYGATGTPATPFSAAV